jgi:hypothetical protein
LIFNPRDIAIFMALLPYFNRVYFLTQYAAKKFPLQTDEGPPDWATLPLSDTVPGADHEYINSVEASLFRGDDPDPGSRRPHL